MLSRDEPKEPPAEIVDPDFHRKMTFSEHLEELRSRLIRATVVVGGLFALAMIFNDSVVDLVLRPYFLARERLGDEGKDLRLTYIDPTEGFFFYMKAAFLAAMLVGMPYGLYQMWQFIAAGLYPKERRAVMRLLPVSLGLFLAGAVFSYLWLLPIALSFLMNYGDHATVKADFRLDSYFGFFLMMCVLLGLVFQLPLIQVVLARFGLVPVAMQRKYRRHFILGAVIGSAILTPTGDAVTLTLVAGPMLILFEIGLLVAGKTRAGTVAGALDMQIGLVGFPGAGRSTLFKALTGLEPAPLTGLLLQHKSVGMVRVPDLRLDWCREAFQPKKFTPAQVEFVDFAGIPRTTEKGKAELFAQMRTMDALALVVSAFDGATDATAVPGPPLARVKALNEEFLFADLEIIERRLEKLEQNFQKGVTKTKDRDEIEMALMKRCREAIETGKSLEGIAQKKEEEELLTTYRFLTAKPQVVIATAAEGQNLTAIAAELKRGASGPAFAVLSQVEAEIAGMEPAERAAFLAEYGLERPVAEAAIRAAFQATRRITFFTVGEDEVRAWEIKDGDNALTAAGRIHSDIARGFIRGEVIAFEDLKKCGSMKQAKADNKLRLEGKEHVVKDGDIVHFRFSV